MKRALTALALLAAAATHASGDADSDWRSILALDAGPPEQPTDLATARTLAIRHLALTRARLEGFLAEHPDDPRAIDARIRLASLDAAAGAIENRQSLVDGAIRSLAAIEADRSASRDQRAEAGFRRVCLVMRSLRTQTARRRADIVAAARNFQSRHPGDKRIPALLAEVATICDGDPALKRRLLEEAAKSSPAPPLARRIADDLRRLDLLGKPLDLEFTTLDGTPWSTTSMRGRVGILVFWSADSAPCLLWLDEFRRGLGAGGSGDLAIATYALDPEPDPVRAALADLSISRWPTGWNDKGWEGRIPRACGINALPTVFVLDRKGNLRSINARHSLDSWVRQLVVERP